MSTLDTQSDALARVYASSLFELAEAEGGQARIEQVVAELEEILELARQDKRFAEFLSSQILPAKKRAESLRRIFEGHVSDMTLRFLLVLNDKGRLARLGSVVTAIDEMVQERFGRIEVDVYTATPLEQSQVDAIADRLRTVLGREPVIHPYVEPDMLGGLKMRIGDQLIDASIETQVRRLNERLKVNGAAEIRARIDRLLEGGS